MGLGDDDLHQKMVEYRELLQPFLDMAKQIPEDWPDEDYIRIINKSTADPPWSRRIEKMGHLPRNLSESSNPILPTVGHFRAIVKAVEEWEESG